jgi:NTP pyrophosphatase (non-canonical NTP hydrolase)
MAPTLKVARERHEDPKNVAKGDYLRDLFVLWRKSNQEHSELELALNKFDEGKDTLEHIRSECGDVIITTAMLLLKIEAMLLGEGCRDPEKESKDEN